MNAPLSNAQALQSLGLSGEVVGPQHADYERARTVKYGGIDKHPAAIVYAAGTDDVVRIVNFARERGIELAVRSGGHSSAGHSTTEGGVVLNVSRMNQAEIDAATRTVWVGPGKTAAELTAELEPHRLIVGFGDAGTVGISGIVSGGGVGYLSRKYGLSIDSLLAAEIVTADGRVLMVDDKNHPDLFWAIRGGGGNFGVITRLKLRLYPLADFTGGMMVLPATPETVAGFAAAADAAPEELSTIANVMSAPPMPFLPQEWIGKPIIFGMLAYAGEPAAAEKALAPFRALAKPLADFVKPGSYGTMYPPEDPDYRPLAVARTMFADHIGKAEAGTIMDYLNKSDAPMKVAQIRVLGGALSRVPSDATAFAHRKRNVMINVASFYTGPDDKPKRQKWVDDFWAALNQGDSGAYVNFLSDEGPDRVRAAYPGKTWDRLREIKAKYDPRNLFRLNQNIPPA